MESTPFVNIDPLLQVALSVLAKRVVEYYMLKECAGDQDKEILQEMENTIKESKVFISKMRGAQNVLEMICG